MRVKNVVQDRFLMGLGLKDAKSLDTGIAYPITLILSMIIKNLLRRIGQQITKRHSQIVGEAEYTIAAVLDNIAKKVLQMENPKEVSITNTFASIAQIAQMAKLGASTVGTRRTGDALSEAMDLIQVKAIKDSNPGTGDQRATNPTAFIFNGLLTPAGDPRMESSLNLPPIPLDIKISPNDSVPNQSAFAERLIAHAGRGIEYVLPRSQVLSATSSIMNIFMFINGSKFTELKYWDQLAYLVAFQQFLKMTATKEDYEKNFPNMMQRATPSTMASILTNACELYSMFYTEMSMISNYAQLAFTEIIVEDTVPFLKKMTGIKTTQILLRIEKWIATLAIPSQHYSSIRSGVRTATKSVKDMYAVNYMISPRAYSLILSQVDTEELEELTAKKEQILYTKGSSAIDKTKILSFYIAEAVQGKIINMLEDSISSSEILARLTRSNLENAQGVMTDPSHITWGNEYITDIIQLSVRGSLVDMIPPDMGNTYDLDLAISMYNLQTPPSGGMPTRTMEISKYMWATIDLRAFMLEQRNQQTMTYAFTDAPTPSESSDSAFPALSLLPLQYVTGYTDTKVFNFYTIEMMGRHIKHEMNEHMSYLQFMFYKLASSASMTQEVVDILAAYAIVYEKENNVWQPLNPTYPTVYGVSWTAFQEKNAAKIESLLAKDVPTDYVSKFVFLDNQGSMCDIVNNPNLSIERAPLSDPRYCVVLHKYLPSKINTESLPMVASNGSTIPIPVDSRIFTKALKTQSIFNSTKSIIKAVNELIGGYTLSSLTDIGLEWSLWLHCGNIAAYRPHITMESRFKNDQKLILSQLDTTHPISTGFGLPEWHRTQSGAAKLGITLITEPFFIDPETVNEMMKVSEDAAKNIELHIINSNTPQAANLNPATMTGEPQTINKPAATDGDINAQIGLASEKTAKTTDQVEAEINGNVI